MGKATGKQTYIKKETKSVRNGNAMDSNSNMADQVRIFLVFFSNLYENGFILYCREMVHHNQHKFDIKK